jgi:hypothetical protein
VASRPPHSSAQPLSYAPPSKPYTHKTWFDSKRCDQPQRCRVDGTSFIRKQLPRGLDTRAYDPFRVSRRAEPTRIGNAQSVGSTPKQHDAPLTRTRTLFFALRRSSPTRTKEESQVRILPHAARRA